MNWLRKLALKYYPVPYKSGCPGCGMRPQTAYDCPKPGCNPFCGFATLEHCDDIILPWITHIWRPVLDKIKSIDFHIGIIVFSITILFLYGTFEALIVHPFMVDPLGAFLYLSLFVIELGILYVSSRFIKDS